MRQRQAISRAETCAYDPAFQWLTGMEEINLHTLSDFRVGHGERLPELLAQVPGLLSAEGLVSGAGDA
jgi:transposase